MKNGSFLLISKCVISYKINPKWHHVPLRLYTCKFIIRKPYTCLYGTVITHSSSTMFIKLYKLTFF
jgi:hypothetical protein